MRGISEIHRRNLKDLIDEVHGGNQTRFSDAMGFKNPSLVSRYLSTNPKTFKTIGKNLARRIESVHGKPEFWMDHHHAGLAAVGGDKNLLQLIELYNQLNEVNQAKVLQEVNFLHNMEFPNKSTSNPYPHLPNGREVAGLTVHEQTSDYATTPPKK